MSRLKMSQREDSSFQSDSDGEVMLHAVNLSLDVLTDHLKESKFSMKSIVDAYETLQGLGRAIDTFIVEHGGTANWYKKFFPANTRMADIGNQISAKLLEGKGMNEWYDSLVFQISNFLDVWSVERIRKSIDSGQYDISIVIAEIRATLDLLRNNIEQYEKKFGTTFDPSMVDKIENHLRTLESEFKIFLGEEKVSDKPLDIQTIDEDQLLDLYQEIERMPLDDENRLNKIREFERLQRILKKGSLFTMKKISLRDMEKLEKPLVQRFAPPIFKPDTETGIAQEFESPEFSPEKKDVFKHQEPTKVLSDYELLNSIGQMPADRRDSRIVRLKYLQKAHDMLLEQMFSDLGKKLAHKEISERFWDTLPAEIRGKYKDKIGGIRSKIRAIYELFPQHFEQYKKENRPYFRKQKT